MESRVIRTVLLASYPKSGNTWMRVFIANLTATDTPTDINALPELSHFACERQAPTHGHTAESAHASVPDTGFIKVHDAYLLACKDNPRHRDASGAIVIVRDPRDIAPSLAAHSRNTVDDTIALLGDPGAVPATANQPSRRKLTCWSHHVASWLEQKDMPVHLVRYEDLIADPITSFRRALRFAGVTVGDSIVRRAVAFSEFRQLRAQELEKGFREAQLSEGRFLRRGVAGGWRDELTAAQVARIESDHGSMMHRLGYARSSRLKVVASKI
jgi:hypothetical protein